MAEPEFYFSDEQRELQRALREFVSKEIAPIAAKCDAEERYPVELFRKLGELGYLGLRFPEEVGGSGGSNLDYAILCEELAYGSAGIALGIYVHMALACAALEAFGSETLKKTWLPPALRGEKIGAWAFAEAGAGSDAGAVATRAVADGDGYVLNGSKIFIRWQTISSKGSHTNSNTINASFRPRRWRCSKRASGVYWTSNPACHMR